MSADAKPNAASALLAVAVLGVVAILILPAPPGIIDLLLALSIGLAVLMLLVALSLKRPLDFSVFPSLPNAVKTSGGRHPVASSALSSACSRSARSLPSLARLSCMTGARSTRDHRSTTY